MSHAFVPLSGVIAEAVMPIRIVCRLFAEPTLPVRLSETPLAFVDISAWVPEYTITVAIACAALPVVTRTGRVLTGYRASPAASDASD